jgi:hypothetical protein
VAIGSASRTILFLECFDRSFDRLQAVLDHTADLFDRDIRYTCKCAAEPLFDIFHACSPMIGIFVLAS